MANQTTPAIQVKDSNVGIGTAAPSDKLHVYGGRIVIDNTLANQSAIQFNQAGTEMGVIYRPGGISTQLRFYLTGAGDVITLNSSGNVGIGTTSPSFTLSVQGIAQARGGVYVTQSSPTNTLVLDADDTSLHKIFTNSSVDLSLGTNSSTSQLYLKNGGNVGIGTTNPNRNLTVSGNGTLLGVQSNTVGGYSEIEMTANGVSAGYIFKLSAGNSSYAGAGSLNIYNSGSIGFHTASVTNSMFIASATGNVGIGNTVPGSKLDVISGTTQIADFRSTIIDGLTNIRIVNDAQTTSTGNSPAAIELVGKRGTSTHGRHAWIGAEGVDGTTYRTQIKFKIRPEDSPYQWSTLPTQMVIDGNGNVGIGTTSPNALLTVSNTVDNGAAVRVQRTNALSGSYTELGTVGGSGRIESFNGNLTIGADANNTDSSSVIQFKVDNSEKVRIDSSGNVGIGTTSPSEKLHVDGNAILTYNNSYQGINSVGNKAILARVSPTSGIINYAEYATATNLNGFVMGSDDARVKGNIATDSLEFITDTSTRMTVTSAGNVGVGTTSPSYRLDVSGDARINAGALGVNIAPSATDGRIDASNDIVAYSSSDRRLKENITPIANALDKVKSLTGVEFDWRPEHKKAHGYEGHDTGVIAQEVQEVMPTAVRTNDTGYLAVRYEKLIGLLIEANKELAARVEELEKKLN